MAINRKPKKYENDINMNDIDKFIDAGNSASSEEKKTSKKMKKIPVALRFDPTLLDNIDKIAEHRGMSRNALISYWCSKAIEND